MDCNNFNHNEWVQTVRSLELIWLFTQKMQRNLCLHFIQIKDQTLSRDINTTIFPIPASGPRLPRSLAVCGPADPRVVTVLLVSDPSSRSQSLLRPRVTTVLHRHKHRSIIKREPAEDTFYHLSLTFRCHYCAETDTGQAALSRLLTTHCDRGPRLRGKSGHCPGAWERDSVSEASSCCLLRNVHGYIWYCHPPTRPWLCCSKGRII